MYTIRVYHTYVSVYRFREEVKRKLSESIPHFYNLFVSLSYKCLFQGGHSLFFKFSHSFISTFFFYNIHSHVHQISLQTVNWFKLFHSISFILLRRFEFSECCFSVISEVMMPRFASKGCCAILCEVSFWLFHKCEWKIKTQFKNRGDVISKCEQEFKRSKVKTRAFKGVLSQNVNKN